MDKGELESRLDLLERETKEFQRRSYFSDGVIEVLKACKEKNIVSYELVRVEEGYYEKTLEMRRRELAAPSPEHLCKSMLMENFLCTNEDIHDPKNSRYYLVVIQYTTQIDSHKLYKFVKNVLNEKKISSKNFKFRLAEDSTELTGFDHNGVGPMGLKNDIPIIFSNKILDLNPAVFFMGAGHESVKLRLNVKEFIDKMEPFIGDISSF